jgi:hypothetical protein
MTERDHLEKLFGVIAEERRILLGGRSQTPTASAAIASAGDAPADAEILRVEASYLRVLDAIQLCIASIDADRGRRA